MSVEIETASSPQSAAPGKTTRQRVAILLHTLLVIGLLALAVRYYVTTTDRTRPNYDGWFSSLDAVIGVVEIVGAAGLVMFTMAYLVWRGRSLPIALLDLILAFSLFSITLGRVQATGEVTVGRALALVLAVLATLGALSLVRAWPRQARPPAEGPMW